MPALPLTVPEPLPVVPARPADDEAVPEALHSCLPKRAATEILTEALEGLRPFEPRTPLRDLARRVLARKLKVAHGARTKPRRIAIVGRTNSGRTTTTARLANVYASTGLNVVALSLEPVRSAFELGEQTDPDAVRLEVASTPDLVARAVDVLDEQEIGVIVADLPALDPASDESVESTLELLDALDPDEIHLTIRAQGTLEDSLAVAHALAPWKKCCRVLATRTDAGGGAAVGLALAARMPVSFVSTVADLRPAEPDQLARLVLP
jgi:signal recognition particle GTPase